MVPDDRLAAAVAELVTGSGGGRGLYGATGHELAASGARCRRPRGREGDRCPAQAYPRGLGGQPAGARGSERAAGKLAELAGALRAAQQAKHGPRLRELSAARGALVDALDRPGLRHGWLARPAAVAALGGHARRSPPRSPIPRSAAAFATGTLTRAMQWSGFGVLPADGDSGPNAAIPGGVTADKSVAGADDPAEQDRDPGSGRARLRSVPAEVAQPRQRSGQGGSRRPAEATAARRQAAEAELLERAEERAARRREQYEEAERAVTAAASAAAEALSAEDQLEAEVRDLEQRLTQARADLAAARIRARHAEAAERRARQALDRFSLATHHRCRITHLKEHGI